MYRCTEKKKGERGVCSRLLCHSLASWGNSSLRTSVPPVDQLNIVRGYKLEESEESGQVFSTCPLCDQLRLTPGCLCTFWSIIPLLSLWGMKTPLSFLDLLRFSALFGHFDWWAWKNLKFSLCLWSICKVRLRFVSKEVSWHLQNLLSTLTEGLVLWFGYKNCSTSIWAHCPW